MYDHVTGGSIFHLGHGFHLCALSETLLLAPDPWMALPTSSWHTYPAAPRIHFCKCPMECVLCSRYCIGTRALNLDRPGLVPILMEEDSLTQSVQIQLPFSPTHDPVPPIIPVSSAGLILKGLNGIRGPCTPILT